MKRGLLISVVAFYMVALPSWSATISVNASNTPDCPCNPTPPTACGTVAEPYSCISNALDHAGLQAGDLIDVQSGTYNECVLVDKDGASGQPITIRSQAVGGAVIRYDSSHWQCPSMGETLALRAKYVVLDGFRVTTPTGTETVNGIFLLEPTANQSIGNIIKNVEVDGHVEGFRITANAGTSNLNLRIENSNAHDNSGIGVHVLGPGIQIVDGQSHHNDGDGVKIEAANTVIDGTHIHHNGKNGVLEVGPAGIGSTIKNCEVDNNGNDTRYDHGLYINGTNGTLKNNRVHHNASFGIHLWEAPQNYVVEGNEVFSNGGSWGPIPNDYECSTLTFNRSVGGGIVLGGGGSVPPVNVDVRYNVVHHNQSIGLYYLVGAGVGDSGNVFHHNSVFANGTQQVLIIGGATNHVAFKNNIIVGSDQDNPGSLDYLVLATNTTLDSNSLDGNLYLHPLGTTASPLFSWNESLYAFTQLSSLLSQDQHSTWNADIRFVDPDASPLTEFGKISNGDYHLRIGSPAIVGVCCVSGGVGVLDIDGEQVAACTANCTSPGNGIGADSYKDGDADGTADRYDCNPTKKGIKTLCDGDSVSQNAEASACGSQPGAAYLSSIYPAQGPSPGAPEICDGNDNDCVGGVSGEVDGDFDGAFLACGPTSSWDCGDGDADVYPGAQQFCDGKDNLCPPAPWALDVDSDGDGYFDCYQLTTSWSFDCQPCFCCSNPSANEICGNGRDDDCDGQTDEAGCASETDCTSRCP